MACAATNHNTTVHSYRRGCRCPATVAVARAKWSAENTLRRIRAANQPRVRPSEHVDLVAVNRACLGERLRLTRAERAAVITKLTARGRSASDIAPLAGCQPRTVTRHRARNRAARQATTQGRVAA